MSKKDFILVGSLFFLTLFAGIAVLVSNWNNLAQKKTLTSKAAEEAPKIYYVDGKLALDTCASYSISTRDCSGAIGTIASKTVNYALRQLAKRTDTIIVREGEYKELGSGRTQGQVSFDIDKQVSLMAYRDASRNIEAVTLTFPDGQPPRDSDGHYGKIVNIASQNVTLDGFTIIGTYGLDLDKDGKPDDFPGDQDVNIKLQPRAANVIIRNNKIIKFGHAGIKFSTRLLGPVIIENNEIANGGLDSARDHGIYSAATDPNPKIIRYNFFHDISAYGIQIVGGNQQACPDQTQPRNHEVYGNISVRNGGGMLVGGPNNKVVNNVFYANRVGLMLWRGGEHNNLIKNNIFWNNNDAGIQSDLRCDASCGVGFGDDVGYNDIGGKRNCSSSQYNSSTDLNQDPKFSPANPQASPTEWFDFRLASGSGLIDKGFNAGEPFNLMLDSNNISRLGMLTDQNCFAGWEIGAFVFNTGVQCNVGLQPTMAPYQRANTLTVIISSPSDGVTISGVTRFRGFAGGGASRVSRVELLVDSVVRHVGRVPAFDFPLDTNQISNGSHNLTVRAANQAGATASASISVTVKN